MTISMDLLATESLADGPRAKAIEILAEPSPCDECEFARRCADEELACALFVTFVAHGQRWRRREHQPRVPTAESFKALDRISGGVDDTQDPEFLARWEALMNPPDKGDSDARAENEISCRGGREAGTTARDDGAGDVAASGTGAEVQPRASAAA